jgi:hypothetical protein
MARARNAAEWRRLAIVQVEGDTAGMPCYISDQDCGAGRLRQGLAERLDELAKECAALPDYDTRAPDEIIGYDEYGVPR